eukprot:1881678-Rhodomonas_salina.1
MKTTSPAEDSRLMEHYISSMLAINVTDMRCNSPCQTQQGNTSKRGLDRLKERKMVVMKVRSSGRRLTDRNGRSARIVRSDFQPDWLDPVSTRRYINSAQHGHCVSERRQIAATVSARLIAQPSEQASRYAQIRQWRLVREEDRGGDQA